MVLIRVKNGIFCLLRTEIFQFLLIQNNIILTIFSNKNKKKIELQTSPRRIQAICDENQPLFEHLLPIPLTHVSEILIIQYRTEIQKNKIRVRIIILCKHKKNTLSNKKKLYQANDITSFSIKQMALLVLVSSNDITNFSIKQWHY